MNNVERIARVLFGGDSHDVTRRAANQLLPEGLLAELGLARRSSHLGAALTLLGAGVVIGAAGYHVLGPNGRQTRMRMLAWMRAMGDEVAEMTHIRKSDGVASTDDGASAKREHVQHS